MNAQKAVDMFEIRPRPYTDIYSIDLSIHEANIKADESLSKETCEELLAFMDHMKCDETSYKEALVNLHMTNQVIQDILRVVETYEDHQKELESPIIALLWSLPVSLETSVSMEDALMYQHSKRYVVSQVLCHWVLAVARAAIKVDTSPQGLVDVFFSKLYRQAPRLESQRSVNSQSNAGTDYSRGLSRASSIQSRVSFALNADPIANATGIIPKPYNTKNNVSGTQKREKNANANANANASKKPKKPKTNANGPNAPKTQQGGAGLGLLQVFKQVLIKCFPPNKVAPNPPQAKTKRAFATLTTGNLHTPVKRRLTDYLLDVQHELINPVNLIIQKNENLCFFIAHLTVIFTSKHIRPLIAKRIQEGKHIEAKKAFFEVIETLYNNGHMSRKLKQIQEFIQNKQEAQNQETVELLVSLVMSEIQFSTTDFMKKLNAINDTFPSPDTVWANKATTIKYMKHLLSEIGLNYVFLFRRDTELYWNEAIQKQFTNTPPKQDTIVIYLSPGDYDSFIDGRVLNIHGYKITKEERKELYHDAIKIPIADLKDIKTGHDIQISGISGLLGPVNIKQQGYVLMSFCCFSGSSEDRDFKALAKMTPEQRAENKFNMHVHEPLIGHAISGYLQDDMQGKEGQYLYNGHSSEILNVPCPPWSLQDDATKTWDYMEDYYFFYNMNERCTMQTIDEVSNYIGKLVKGKTMTPYEFYKDAAALQLYKQIFMKYKLSYSSSMVMGYGVLTSNATLGKPSKKAPTWTRCNLDYKSSYIAEETPVIMDVEKELERLKDIITNATSKAPKVPSTGRPKKQLKPIENTFTDTVYVAPHIPTGFIGKQLWNKLSAYNPDYDCYLTEFEPQPGNANNGKIKCTAHGVDFEVGVDLLLFEFLSFLFPYPNASSTNNSIMPFLFVKDKQAVMGDKLVYVNGIFNYGGEITQHDIDGKTTYQCKLAAESADAPVLSTVAEMIQTCLNAFEVELGTYSTRKKKSVFTYEGYEVFKRLTGIISDRFCHIVKDVYNLPLTELSAFGVDYKTYVSNIAHAIVLNCSRLYPHVAKADAMYITTLRIISSFIGRLMTLCFYNEYVDWTSDYYAACLEEVLGFSNAGANISPTNASALKQFGTGAHLSSVQVRNAVVKNIKPASNAKNQASVNLPGVPSPEITPAGGGAPTKLKKTDEKRLCNGKHYCIYKDAKNRKYIKTKGQYVPAPKKR